MRFASILLLLVAACQPAGLTRSRPGSGPSPDGPEDTDTTDDTDVLDDTDLVDDGPLGFIGSPCDTKADCDYPDAVCLGEDDGFPRGVCSQACDQYCPDESGFPTTFCVDEKHLDVAISDDGSCFSQCDFGTFPSTGCRTDYSCQKVSRANDSGTERFACLPGDEPIGLSACQQELASLGVSFSPTVISDTSPSTHPSLTCHVEDPVLVHSPVLGVDLKYYEGSPTSTVKMSCEGAVALAETIEDVKAEGVTALRHIGTYNCRVISGTSTLSRHAYGDAIDIYGFELGSTLYTCVDDWEHDTTNPSSTAAQFLYDAAYRWHDDKIWNIILTPNYNSGHDNHFHNDMTPGSNYIGAQGPDCGGPGIHDIDHPDLDQWWERQGPF